MSTATFQNLGDLRERLVNLRAATVADLAGIPRERLLSIEEGAPPSVFEIERLAAVMASRPTRSGTTPSTSTRPTPSVCWRARRSSAA